MDRVAKDLALLESRWGMDVLASYSLGYFVYGVLKPP